MKEIDNALEVINACLNGLSEVIPPTFCWKQGGDAGEIPTKCPPSHPNRIAALCYEACQAGYTQDWAGTCWENCQPGFEDHGWTCFQHVFNFYFKKSYIAGSITNFDSRVQCYDRLYKSGALCYRDCGLVMLQNCGIGACATDGWVCGNEIAKMTVAVFEGIYKAVQFALSLGASSATEAAKGAAKEAFKDKMSRIGKEAMKKIY